LVAAVAAAALFTFSNAHGQTNDNSAVFQGRPVPSGANGGTGALAGPPQGGIALQGIEHSGVALRPPSGLRDMPQGTVDPAADSIAVNRAVRNDKDIVPRDNSFSPEQVRAKKKAKRVAKNTHDAAKHGVASIQ
jgi:hypothetical protein